MSRPYSPATDATPRDSDLDPHAGCREREAAAIRAAVLAERERCAGIADGYAARMRAAGKDREAAGKPFIVAFSKASVSEDIAAAIREAPPPHE